MIGYRMNRTVFRKEEVTSHVMIHGPAAWHCDHGVKPYRSMAAGLLGTWRKDASCQIGP